MGIPGKIKTIIFTKIDIKTINSIFTCAFRSADGFMAIFIKEGSFFSFNADLSAVDKWSGVEAKYPLKLPNALDIFSYRAPAVKLIGGRLAYVFS